MSHPVIHIDHIAKRYRLGAGPGGRGDFRDAIRAGLRGLRHRLGRGAPTDRGGERDLWALRDINLDIEAGTAVGIIGHNGAGKSTLLKILSRITDPTEGELWYEGRIGSLLEVGTGFHPELSGRENIYLNGTILGMTRREISDKFEQIVDFSEIGRFLDTPVKRYSSGMYVRLAFAVAAHLEPEILVVDEVLAVGDSAFQRKCIDKMKAIADGGRTILFVSHNMGAIQALCDRAIVLDAGRITVDDRPTAAIKQYLKQISSQRDTPVAERQDRSGLGNTRIVAASIYSQDQADVPGMLIYGLTAWITVAVDRWLRDLSCIIAVYDDMGRLVSRFSSRNAAPVDRMVKGRVFTCEIPKLALIPGRYLVNLAVNSNAGMEDHVNAAFCFDVENGTLNGRRLEERQFSSTFAPEHRWLNAGGDGEPV